MPRLEKENKELKKTLVMINEIRIYNEQLTLEDKVICDIIAHSIGVTLPHSTGKIWHAHPVWFIKDNPIVGYSKQKAGIRLMFWSGADFDEPMLDIVGKKFKDASVFYTSSHQINIHDLERWLKKSEIIQWDYKNLAKRKGKLERI